MIEAEYKFYMCLQDKTPPEPTEKDFKERNDATWTNYALRWKCLKDAMEKMEKEEEQIRRELISLAGQSNTKGGGIRLCHVQRKGAVDYSKIPSLKGIDLEPYRKASSSSWRISCN